LAIAAAKLGAAHVDAVDLDPQAVETTRANAAANRVELNPALPDALPAADYDIVVANILAQPLIVLAPLLARHGARIALSGVLQAQADEVVQAYRPWFEIGIADQEDGWVLIAGKRK
jgi:ribosomal protein L11 methyltransferase